MSTVYRPSILTLAYKEKHPRKYKLIQLSLLLLSPLIVLMALGLTVSWCMYVAYRFYVHGEITI